MILAYLGGRKKGEEKLLEVLGYKRVEHSSGKLMFTGPKGYVPRSMAVANEGILLLRYIIKIGTLSVAIELACASRNHPELVAKIEILSGEFYQRTQNYYGHVKDKTLKYLGENVVLVNEKVSRSGSSALEYAGRASVNFSDAINAAKATVY